jgi:hypothetical protein
MPIWTQIGDSLVTSIPPDGRTLVDVYAIFSFSNDYLPEGTAVKFLIGKGRLPQAGQEQEETETRWTLPMIFGSISPVSGIELVSESGEKGFQCTATVKERIVRKTDGTLGFLPAAKCSISPVSDVLDDEITVVAYTDYDKSGKVSRLQPAETSLTIMSGEGTFLPVAERYDPLTDEWESVADMRVGRAGPFCEAANGKVYVAGGFAGNFVDIVEQYDPSSDTWSDRAPLLTALGYGSSVVHGGKIYAIGGYNFSPGRASQLLHRYDPVADKWTRLSDIPVPVSHGCAETVGNAIYLMFGATEFQEKGGEDENPKSLNVAVLKYDILSNSWSPEDVDISPVTIPATSTLSSNSLAGDVVLRIPSGAAFPAYGAATIDRGGTQETVLFSSFDSVLGELRLRSPLAYPHSSGDPIVVVSLPETRIAPNSLADGTTIKVFNGLSYSGLKTSSSTSINATVARYDTLTKSFSKESSSPTLPRLRAADALISVGGTDRVYAMGGSAGKSDFLNDLEYYDVIGSSFVGNLSDMLYSRQSLGATSLGGYVYAIGGGGSGHPPGWLQITVETNPASVLADGKQTSGVLVRATDDSGDPPPNGTVFKAKGVVYLKLTEEEKASAAKSAPQTTETGTFIAEPPPIVSLLPVTFSSPAMVMQDGVAATVLLGRSEDPIREVENLFQYVKNGESVPPEEALKTKNAGFRHPTQKVGEQRSLYGIGVEISVQDDFYFGRTDTNGTISGETSNRDLSTMSSGFVFNPPTSKQDLSGSVEFYSDITSIPDVDVVTEEPVKVAAAKEILKEMREEVPFGASPHLDAIVSGARARTGKEPALPLPPPSETMVTASDNDDNYSSYSAPEVVLEVNEARGRLMFPVFVTSFIVTDPVSLAARRARTDVADLETISSGTGGNSFSVVDQSYVDFVIGRIRKSAPSSVGSGIVLATKELEGTLRSVSFVVEGVPGNPGSVPGAATNSAEMRVWLSDDGYNFGELGVAIRPNFVYQLPVPARASHVRYEVTLRSRTYDSPILKSVSLNYVEDNVKYVFTLPQAVAGQLSEIAVTANHRLPTGGKAEGGVFHGDSVMFERDYESRNQPSVQERGTILLVNRSFDTNLSNDSSQPTDDFLRTDDFLVYRSVSGPWSQDAATVVFLNGTEASPADYLAFPEDGLVAFRKRLSENDRVSVEVTMPPSFRVGVKVTNPSLDEGKFDEFAFMYGVTQDDVGIRLNRPPKATNLFIDSPVLPGGPLVAHYTFQDADGQEEDVEETEINWFRNGSIVPELKNLRTVTNSDLMARRADSSVGLISKGQEWFFTVRPSDGYSFGNLAVSHSVLISNYPPSVEKLRIESSGGDPQEYLSTRPVVAKYGFVDPDQGDQSKGSVFTWYVNGVEAKTGTANGIEPDEKGEDGRKYLSPNNVIRVEMLPCDGTDFGVLASSPSITVVGTPPKANDVRILPEAPSSASTLRLTYTFVDDDSGTDQSDVAWYRNDERVSELDNSREVNALLTSPRQKWQAVVTPKNGFATGEPTKSNSVLIQF